MKIIRSELSKESGHDAHENDALDPGEMEVRLWLKAGSGRQYSKAVGHVSLRYARDESGVTKEYYLSLFPNNMPSPAVAWYWWLCVKMQNFCQSMLCIQAAKFHNKKDDFDYYRGLTGLSESPLPQRAKFNSIYYRLINDGKSPSFDVESLHAELTAYLGELFGTGFDEINLNSSGGVIAAETDAANYSALHQVPALPDHNAFFKIFACMICCVPRHNCTSFLVKMLEFADIKTDMSRSNTLQRTFFQLMMALGLGYLTGEVIVLGRGHSDDFGDEIFSTVLDAIIILFFASLYLFGDRVARAVQAGSRGLPCISWLTSLFLFSYSQSFADPFKPYTKFAACSGLISSIFAILSFVVHMATSGGKLPERETKDWLIGLGAGLGVTFSSWLALNLYDWLRDWRNGCANPYGLKGVMEHAYSRLGDTRGVSLFVQNPSYGATDSNADPTEVSNQVFDSSV